MLVLRCNKVAIAVALAGAAIAWDANAATPATPPAARPSASASSQSLSTDDRQFAMNPGRLTDKIHQCMLQASIDGIHGSFDLFIIRANQASVRFGNLLNRG